jgi:acetyl esterase/lipase
VRSDWQRPVNVPAAVVRGCLPISGTYYFGENSGLAMRPRFLGEADDDVVSPLKRIEHTPPFLIAYGSEDFPHLVMQAETMAEALRKRDTDVQSLELAGCDHLGASLIAGEIDGPWSKPATAWINGH